MNQTLQESIVDITWWLCFQSNKRVKTIWEKKQTSSITLLLLIHL